MAASIFDRHPGAGPLFIFEMANNHGGDVAHGRRLIRELQVATAAFGVRRAIKFQYRQLDTFIHQDFQSRLDLPYIKRFQETRLNVDQYLRLKSEAEACGFLTVCTGFDEASVDLIERHGYHCLKIASCSLTDWPLLERIAQTALPIIASVAGSPLEDIDRVVSFFEHRQKDFALLHCVAEYPAPDARLNLNQIDLLQSRYPTVPIGFSTHERPELLDAVKLAVAKGAVVLERHVGLPTERSTLNAYSSTPAQAAAWVQAALEADRLCGVGGQRAPFTVHEIQALHSLRRGVFMRQAVGVGAAIDPAAVFLAIPTLPGQLTASDLSKYADLRATRAIPERGAVTRENAAITDRRHAINAIVQRVRDYVRTSRVVLPGKAEVEISHHYGVERFYDSGAVLLNFVNRSYCKKVIVMLPGQSHPEHRHQVKEETFFVLHGSMRISLDGVERPLSAGETILIEPGVKHWFTTETGVIVEEISSTHSAQDSLYTDPFITANASRKTFVTYWLA